jgi:serine/threonine protein kinase
MQPDRWRRIKEVLDVSLRLAPAERPEYLARVCDGDQELRDEVDSLIEAYEEAGDELETTPPAPKDPLLGAMLGPYRVVELIGSGGMGSVYRAERADDVYQKEVAIKVVRNGLDRELMVRHFRLERQIMASLEHPNIARLLDGGATADGAPYFVMEFIRGAPVDRYCLDRRLDIRQRLELFGAICAAVGFAHGIGVVHRDIKPGNILVTAGGAPKLLDFGIAKTVHPDAAKDTAITVAPAMTPEYASPEQQPGGAVTAASDVYSLGILLCELLTGKRPRDGNVPPGLPRDLETIIRMATREEPDRRYASAALFGDDVRRYLEGRPVRARKGAFGYRASKFLRRQRSVALAVAAGLAAPALLYLAIDARGRWGEASAAMQIVTLTSAPGREFQPSFSPDGKGVVYSASGENGENIDVYRQAIGGSQAVRVTTDEAQDLSPVWSPDGARIAWLRTGPKETAIFAAAVAGGVHAKIADLFPTRVESVGRHLDWSPDGASLAASDKEVPGLPFRIVFIDVATGRKRQATMPPENIIGDMAPCFSPDGKWLAFLRAVSSGVGDVWIAPVAGGQPRRVTTDNRSILAMTWGPDGKSIVFSSNRMRNHALWRIPVAGGTPTRVPMVSENASDPAFSRDGRRMVYAQLFEDTNIWRFELDGQRRRARSSPRRSTTPARRSRPMERGSLSAPTGRGRTRFGRATLTAARRGSSRTSAAL